MSKTNISKLGNAVVQDYCKKHDLWTRGLLRFMVSRDDLYKNGTERDNRTATKRLDDSITELVEFGVLVPVECEGEVKDALNRGTLYAVNRSKA